MPFGDILEWSEKFDPESFAVPDFENDSGFVEHKEPAIVGASAVNVAVLAMAAGGGVGGTSLANMGQTSESQSLFQHSSPGITQAESMQQIVAAIPSGAGGQSSNEFGFLN